MSSEIKFSAKDLLTALTAAHRANPYYDTFYKFVKGFPEVNVVKYDHLLHCDSVVVDFSAGRMDKRQLPTFTVMLDEEIVASIKMTSVALYFTNVLTGMGLQDWSLESVVEAMKLPSFKPRLISEVKLSTCKAEEDPSKHIVDFSVTEIKGEPTLTITLASGDTVDFTLDEVTLKNIKPKFYTPTVDKETARELFKSLLSVTGSPLVSVEGTGLIPVNSSEGTDSETIMVGCTRGNLPTDGKILPIDYYEATDGVAVSIFPPDLLASVLSVVHGDGGRTPLDKETFMDKLTSTPQTLLEDVWTELKESYQYYLGTAALRTQNDLKLIYIREGRLIITCKASFSEGCDTQLDGFQFELDHSLDDLYSDYTTLMGLMDTHVTITSIEESMKKDGTL